MSNLRFKRLLLLSDSTRSAGQFEFSDQLTLITAKDNSVGKSSLVKFIFWSLGCDPTIDTIGKSLDIKAILYFSIGDERFNVRRYKNSISIRKEGDEYKHFDKITGDYSIYLAGLLNFKARLPSRKKDVVEVPPPAYYFVPFYIDQVKSWSSAWNNFENLGQYGNWKSTIIEYHVGILTDKYFDYSDKISEFSLSLSDTNIRIKKLESAYEVIESQKPRTVTTVDINDFDDMTDEVSYQLKLLADDQEKLLHEMAANQSNMSYVDSQVEISNAIVQELDKDYKFSVENIQGDYFDCPLCGTTHENSVVNRSSILADKEQAQIQLQVLLEEQISLRNKYVRLREKVKKVRGGIEAINKKYKPKKDSELELTDVIEQIASNTIQARIESKRVLEIFEEKNLKDSIARFKKQRTETTTKARRERIENNFSSTFTDFVEKLDAEAVNISGINKPKDYNQVVREGGAAEGVRAILAYYLTIFTMIKSHSKEVVAPLVIDTPNQHEQSEGNYTRILDLLKSKKFADSQIIICAMDNNNLSALKNYAEIIVIDKVKLLTPELYTKIHPEFEKQTE